jgi:hypothetical protein
MAVMNWTTSLRVAQEAWDGRTPMDDEPPEEHDFSGEIFFGSDDQFRADFTDGGLDGITIIEPHRYLTGFNLSKIVDEAHQLAMELWLAEMAAFADDEDGC